MIDLTLSPLSPRDKEKDDKEITRIISARRASRKERKKYEAKENRLFGYSGAFRQAASAYAPGRPADRGRRAEKAHAFKLDTKVLDRKRYPQI